MVTPRVEVSLVHQVGYQAYITSPVARLRGDWLCKKGFRSCLFVN